jgi:regulator of sigma E protease
MISTIIFLFILGILIIIHEFGHFIIAKRIGVRVENFSLGFGPRLLSKKKNGTQYSLSLIPLGGYVKLAGDSIEEYKGQPDEYYTQAPGKRAAIVFFGPLLNYLLGFLCFWLVFFAGYPTLTTKVGGLIDGFGAKEAGIAVGDRVTAVDGKRVDYWEDLQNIIQSKKMNNLVRLSLLRDNKEYNIEVKIKEKVFNDVLGEKRSVGLLGISASDEILKVKHGFIESFPLAIKRTADLTVITYKALWRMVSGKLSLRESVTGPLGIFYATSKAASMGVVVLLHFVAVLSISLAIFNLLPLPVLDGGHILLLAIEKIRRKALSLKLERALTQIGLTLIVSLALFVTYNDLVRLFGDKISKLFNK